jgi:hypothetical protein
MIHQINQLKLYQVWNGYKAEVMPEANTFGVYAITNPLIANKTTNYLNQTCLNMGTADGGTVGKVLCYKLKGRWFDSRWCH